MSIKSPGHTPQAQAVGTDGLFRDNGEAIAFHWTEGTSTVFRPGMKQTAISLKSQVLARSPAELTGKSIRSGHLSGSLLSLIHI